MTQLTGKKLLIIFFFCLFLGMALLFDIAADEQFISDSCTLFPDTYKSNNYSHCCKQHDHDYFYGGAYTMRKSSDLELYVCVAQQTNVLYARIMYFGVRIAGSPYFPTYFRWGFGQDYGQFYTK